MPMLSFQVWPKFDIQINQSAALINPLKIKKLEYFSSSIFKAANQAANPLAF